MKTVLISIALLVPLTRIHAQTASLNAEITVQQAFRSFRQEIYKSTDQKELGWLGDASAVALTKIIGGKALDEADIRSILLIITLSYSAPRVVAAEADRQPRTTLFLLRCLDSSTTDTKLKQGVATTRAYVEDQYSRFLKESPNAPAPR